MHITDRMREYAVAGPGGQPRFDLVVEAAVPIVEVLVVVLIVVSAAVFLVVAVELVVAVIVVCR